MSDQSLNMEKSLLSDGNEKLSPYRKLSLVGTHEVLKNSFDLTPEDELTRLRGKHLQVVKERDDYNIRLIALQEKWVLQINRLKSKNKFLKQQLEAERRLCKLRKDEENSYRQTIDDQEVISNTLQRENEDIRHMLEEREWELNRIPEQSVEKHIAFSPRGDESRSSSESQDYELQQMPELFNSPPTTVRSPRSLVSSWTAPTRRRMKSFREISRVRAVDEAVLDLVKEFEAIGISLPLRKEKDFVYSFHKNRLLLSIRLGKLHVRTKRGFQEFLSFLGQMNF